MTNPLTMRHATPEEAPRVFEILEDGKRAIARFGIEQWQHGYPDLASVEADIALGACYVAVNGAGNLVGTLALRYDVDPEYSVAPVSWLTRNLDDAGEPPYASVHRTATAAEAARQGVMGFLIEGAGEIAHAAGKQSLRIDTHPGNQAMRGFLTRHGFVELEPFELVTKKNGETDLTRIAYEKRLG